MPTQSRNCPVCGKEFFKHISTKRWESNQGKYCSRKCFGASLKDSPGKPTRRVGWPSSPVMLDNGSVIHWDEAAYNVKSDYRVPVTCGTCQNTRTIEATNIVKGRVAKTFTGLCDLCRKKSATTIRGKYHKSWRGGIFVTGGYRHVHLAALSSEILELTYPMRRKIAHGSYSISEHRLIMALHLGRPLLRSEVVHHRNGNKLDNRIENLELTTGPEHRKLDVKYYNLWTQALLRITELESEISELRDKLLRF